MNLYNQILRTFVKKSFVSIFVVGFLFSVACFAQQLEIHHIDVGQADATLIKSPTGVTMLIDAGNNGDGTNIVLPYLSSLGITSLNYVASSHYHEDHIGGLDEVINGLGTSNIGAVYDRGSDNLPTTGTFNDYAAAANATGRRYTVTLGQIIDLGGGVTLKCVATNGTVINYGTVSGATKSENDLSVGWVLTYNSFRYFTGGDLGGESSSYADSETPLATQVGDVDVMKVDHHGSEYSTNQTFVNNLKPEVAIIEVGNGNTYFHPVQSTLDRLVNAHCYIYQTELGNGGTIPTGKGVVANGNIVVKTSGTGYTVTYGSTTDTYNITLATEPTNYVTSFTATLPASTTIQLNWTDAVGAQLPSGYLLMANTTNTFTAPSDGTTYTDDVTLSDGSAAVNITYGSGTYSFSGLNTATQYYFQLYPYNGSGSSINYKTDGTVPSASATTTGTTVTSVTVVSWEVTGQASYGTQGLTATTVATSVVNSAGLTRGSGVTTSGTGAANGWGGTGWTSASSSDAISANIFMTFAFTVKSGYKISLSQLTQNYRRSGTGPSNGAVQYQINSGSWTTIGDYTSLYSSTSSSGASITPIVLSSVTALQNLSVGTIVNFRIVPYGASSSSGTWYVYSLSGDDLILSGTAEAVTNPVEMTSFSAAAVSNRTTLVWKTATEVNNYGFEIERRLISNNSSTSPLSSPYQGGDERGGWNKVGFVAGNGTSNIEHQYSYTEAAVAAEKYAYRLKQIDNDGTYKYSSEAEVQVGTAPKILMLVNYPNPFNPTTTIQFTVPTDGKAVVKILNVLGQEVATVYNGDVNAGVMNTVNFNASMLASGVYFSRLESGGNVQIKKMLLMK